MLLIFDISFAWPAAGHPPYKERYVGLAGHLGQVIHLLTGKDLGQRGQIRGQTLLGLAPQGIEGTAQQGGGELLSLQIIHPAE